MDNNTTSIGFESSFLLTISNMLHLRKSRFETPKKYTKDNQYVRNHRLVVRVNDRFGKSLYEPVYCGLNLIDSTFEVFVDLIVDRSVYSSREYVLYSVELAVLRMTKRSLNEIFSNVVDNLRFKTRNDLAGGCFDKVPVQFLFHHRLLRMF